MNMNKSNEELYFELKEQMFEVLESDDFYKVFTDSMKSGKNNFSLYQRYMNSVIDLKWVEKIEDSLVALDNIIRNPQRFIKETEEVINIEQVKKISENSIRHLAQNTNLIAKVDDRGYITPSKILNVQKDETFETYENRFIYTLLIHLQYFIDKRLKALHDARVKSEYKLQMENEFVIGGEKIEYQLTITSTEKTEKKSKDIDINADTSQMDAVNRVERLIQIMYDFQNSQLIKSLKGVTLVKPPIMRTNVILKNPNFKKALELWQYIETYYDAGVSIDLVENEVLPTEDYINDLFTSTLIHYCMFNHHIKPAKTLAAKSPTLRKIKPNFIQHLVKEYLEDLQIDVDIVEKVFVDKIKRATAKRKEIDKQIAEALQRAIEREKYYLEKQKLQDERRIERAMKEMAKRKKLEEERLRKLEEERLKELALLEELEEKQEEPVEEVKEEKQEEVKVEEVKEEVVETPQEEKPSEPIEEQPQEEIKSEETTEEVTEEIEEESEVTPQEVKEEVVEVTKFEEVKEEVVEPKKKRKNRFLDFLKRLFGKKKSEEVIEEVTEPIEDEEDDDEDEEEVEEHEEAIVDPETGLVVKKPAKTFIEKMLASSEQNLYYYNTLKNELLSYKKVKSRVSKKCDSFRLGRKLEAKIRMAGKSMRLYLALDPMEFNPNVYHHKDMSSKKSYQEVPMVVKVKSERGLKNAIELITIMMAKQDVMKDPKYEEKDYIEELEILKEEMEAEASPIANDTPINEDDDEEYIIDPTTGLITRVPPKPFYERMLETTEQNLYYYNTIKNEFLSYKKVKSRISKKCDSFRLGRKLQAKVRLAGKTIRLYLALDPLEFNPNVYHQKDVSHKKTYAQVPMVVKVKSERGLKNAIDLITILMAKQDVMKDPKYEEKDYIGYLEALRGAMEDDDFEEPEIIFDPETNTFVRKPPKPFMDRMLETTEQNLYYYNTLKNELLSYKKVRSRISKKCDSIRYRRALQAKITMAGKTIKLFLALDPNEFNKNVYHQKDVSNKKTYAKVPMFVRVKSDRGLKNAIDLITIMMEQHNIIKNPKYEEQDYIYELEELKRLKMLEELENQEDEAEELDLPYADMDILDDYGDDLVVRRFYKPFVDRILETTEQNQHYYNTIKNELLSYKKVRSRISKKCDNFRLGRVLKAKLSMAGKTVKLFLALDPNEFNKNVYHQRDMSMKATYAMVPMLVRVKSPRGLKNALELIKVMMENDNVMRNPKYQIKDNIFDLVVLKESVNNPVNTLEDSIKTEEIHLENPSKQSRQLLRARERRIILSKNDKRSLLNKRRSSLKKSKR